MIELKLENEDKILLIDLLEDQIQAIHHEIARTERSEYRQLLKERQARLKHLLEKIEQTQPHPLAA